MFMSLKSRLARNVLWVAAASLLLGACQPPQADLQQVNSGAQQPPSFEPAQLWNSDWQFVASSSDRAWSDIQAETHWQAVTLPHSARLEPKIVNDQWQGFAWYRKQLKAAANWPNKQVFIDFEAAMNGAEVWLNGERLTSHLGGFLPFSVALPKLTAAGDHWLYVKLDNRDNPVTGPKPLKLLDFNTYGGIYRNVWLRVENPTHISDAVAADRVASGGIFVSYPSVSERAAEVQVQTHILRAPKAGALEIKQNLYYQGELIVSNRQTLAASAQPEAQVTQRLSLQQPKLWSPAAPHLYELETLVLAKGELLDRELTTIGVREFTFNNKRLFINGKETFLRGVNRHQEYPYVGYALSDAAQYRDAEKIKAAGFDYVRLSHYPHAKAFMRAADELGLVLLDSILGWQYVSETPEFSAQVLQTCRDLIRRDRNHPSVLAWECSLNESWMQESLIDKFTHAVHEEYPGANVYSAGWQAYGYDIYLQARQHRLEHYSKPEKPYVVSEYGDWEYYAMNAGLQQDSWQNLLQADRSSRQLLSDGEKRLQQQARNLAESHNDNFATPAFADGYWVMFDYNRGYADDLEASGIMSIDRLPKFSYYFYQSQRPAVDSGGPLASGYMVHIASWWQADSALQIPVYTNAERVEIYLNGQLQGETVLAPNFDHLQHPPQYIVLPKFVAGELKAVAYAQGKKVAEQRVSTPGAAARLSLSLDASSLAPQAGQNDLVLVYAQLQDAAGNSTRLQNEKVRFELSGDARLVSPPEVLTEAGVAAALVQLGTDLGSVKISAGYQDLHAQPLGFVP
jgi:beta-galactosidase